MSVLHLFDYGLFNDGLRSFGCTDSNDGVTIEIHLKTIWSELAMSDVLSWNLSCETGANHGNLLDMLSPGPSEHEAEMPLYRKAV
jgi:hypothetical protein